MDTEEIEVLADESATRAGLLAVERGRIKAALESLGEASVLLSQCGGATRDDDIGLREVAKYIRLTRKALTGGRE